MTRRRKLTIGGIVAAVAIAAGSAVGIGAATGEDEQPLTGATKDRAVEAALAHTGGGTVIETETGDDGAAYGVEVRGPDGTVLEVNLDADFSVIGSERDEDGPGEGPDGDDR